MKIYARSSRFAAMIGLCLISAFGTQAIANTDAAPATQQATAVTLANQPADNGASARINLAGKLRMLSQRVVATACYVQTGTMPDVSTGALNATVAEFDIILNALTNGDEALGVFGPEERRKTLVGLEVLSERWATAASLANGIADGQGTLDDLAALAAQSSGVLSVAQKLVVEMNDQYASATAIRQADAILIDISGRQRMMAQRISKNACLLNSGANVEGATDELFTAIDVFASTHDALLTGMPSLGIPAPSTPEISAGLRVVSSHWAIVLPVLTHVLETGEMDDEQSEIMFLGGNDLTSSMNSVVTLIAQEALF